MIDIPLCRLTALVLVAMIAGCASGGSGPSGSTTRLTRGWEATAGNRWPDRREHYEVWRGGELIGHATRRTYPSTYSDLTGKTQVPSHRIDFKLHIDPDSPYDPGYVRLERRVFAASHPHELVSAVFKDGRNEIVEREIKITRGVLGYVASVLMNGELGNIDLLHPRYALTDALTPEAWLAGRPRPGEQLVSHDLDLLKIEPLEVTWRIVGPDPAGDGYEVEVTSNQTPRGTAFFARSDGTPARFKIATYELRRTTAPPTPPSTP